MIFFQILFNIARFDQALFCLWSSNKIWPPLWMFDFQIWLQIFNFAITYSSQFSQQNEFHNFCSQISHQLGWCRVFWSNTNWPTGVWSTSSELRCFNTDEVCSQKCQLLYLQQHSLLHDKVQIYWIFVNYWCKKLYNIGIRDLYYKTFHGSKCCLIVMS